MINRRRRIGDLLPAGVLHIVHGFGMEAGKPLASNKRISRIDFIGMSLESAEGLRFIFSPMKRWSCWRRHVNPPGAADAGAMMDRRFTEHPLRAQAVGEMQLRVPASYPSPKVHACAGGKGATIAPWVMGDEKCGKPSSLPPSCWRRPGLAPSQKCCSALTATISPIIARASGHRRRVN